MRLRGSPFPRMTQRPEIPVQGESSSRRSRWPRFTPLPLLREGPTKAPPQQVRRHGRVAHERRFHRVESTMVETGQVESSTRCAAGFYST